MGGRGIIKKMITGSLPFVFFFTPPTFCVPLTKDHAKKIKKIYLGFNKRAAVSSAGKGGLPLLSTCSLSLESGIQVVELV